MREVSCTEPMRLNCGDRSAAEACRHEREACSLRELLDNDWLHLFAMNARQRSAPSVISQVGSGSGSRTTELRHRSPRCLIPRFDGAILSLRNGRSIMGQVSSRRAPTTPQKRTPSERQYSDPPPGRVMRQHDPRGQSFALRREQGTRHQSQGTLQMAGAGTVRII